MLRTEKLSLLRPNNLFLNERKVRSIQKIWKDGEADRLPPVLVTEIDGELSLIDGHSRAFVAWENGADSIACEFRALEFIEGNAITYKKIHSLALAQGIGSIGDLKQKILSDSEYQEYWIRFCEGLGSAD
jgi:hypothetical protein